MRIGLIAYLLHGGEGYRAAGVSTYAHRLVESLPYASTRHDYVVFHGSDAPPLADVESAKSLLPTQRAPARIVWEQTILPVQAARERVDLLHGLVNVLPLASRRPSVVTLHDVAFLRHPERFPRVKVAYLRGAVAASMWRARHVIAVSENTRSDAVDILRVPEERVTVVYPAADGIFVPKPESEVRRFREAKVDGRPYFLYVGTLEPRKNVDVLIRAFARVRAELDLPHILVLVGGRGWMYQKLFNLIRELGVSDAVRLEGYVAPGELPLWYNAADLFAYPSAYEGFGLPVLEAMACGVPTITTSAGSLAEVAGHACLTVEPGSQEALGDAMRKLLGNGEMRGALRQSGLLRASQFSWEKTARETVAVYERVMGA